jgi:2-phosphosulfolactate phosphatase
MTDIPRIQFVSTENCASANGVVVAVDVYRAFTTAAYAFAAGAERILLVSTVEDALALRQQNPDALLMGEVLGVPVPSFDFWNSPAQFEKVDLTGRMLVQRTSAGTQGIVRSVGAEHLLAASFCVAGATVRAIQRRAPREVTFVLTGLRADHPMDGLEDMACAEYMAALLRGEDPNPADYLTWTQHLNQNRLEGASEEILSQFQADIALCAQVDRFAFALPVQRKDGLLIMQKE